MLQICKMETTHRNKRVAEYLIIDSGGFIKNAPLHEYGQELITLHDVIAEIRDKATKQRLQALPYELQYKEPDSASLQKGITDLSFAWSKGCQWIRQILYCVLYYGV